MRQDKTLRGLAPAPAKNRLSMRRQKTRHDGSPSHHHHHHHHHYRHHDPSAVRCAARTAGCKSLEHSIACGVADAAYKARLLALLRVTVRMGGSDNNDNVEKKEGKVTSDSSVIVSGGKIGGRIVFYHTSCKRRLSLITFTLPEIALTFHPYHPSVPAISAANIIAGYNGSVVWLALNSFLTTEDITQLKCIPRPTNVSAAFHHSLPQQTPYKHLPLPRQVWTLVFFNDKRLNSLGHSFPPATPGYISSQYRLLSYTPYLLPPAPGNQGHESRNGQTNFAPRQHSYFPPTTNMCYMLTPSHTDMGDEGTILRVRKEFRDRLLLVVREHNVKGVMDVMAGNGEDRKSSKGCNGVVAAAVV
ncbi:hypothetical protein DFH27DRAFT_617138 [Peziza echinospora]|nr:hypothetical protein DFH27DRAFT_617138 [Peziza echinospora]